MSDDIGRMATPESLNRKLMAPVGIFAQAPANDDYFYYYQRVYSEINDSDANMAIRNTPLVPNGFLNPSHVNTVKIPVLNNFKQSHLHFAYA